ncbi:arylsulfatase [Tamlana sp. s12]|uniref:arylsulfatase n=1 Tax=Tamlana sp. s12 TaxID=1630406 RepID=UPI0009EDF99F|nr:arylsulfatase [Tamlana sp. s12]
MNRINFSTLVVFLMLCVPNYGQAQKNKKRPTKPNIILLVSDDTGWGDLGVYGGGVGRGMPTPNLDNVAKEGMQFWSFYGQPSCTPGRAAMQTGRIPNRSGMTTVAFQGQGGGLPKAEWTLASVLKKANYNTYFSGKWHLGEADYAMPSNQGYDKMENVVLYHLNAYTYAFPSWNPEMSPEMAEFFQKATKGVLEGEAGKAVKEVSKVTPENIAELDMNMTENVLKQMDVYAKDKNPFFMSINFAKNHQPNLPSKQFKGKSPAKSNYADCVMEMDYNVGRIMNKIKELGIEENTLVIYTVDNGAWQDVYPDAGYTPFRGSKGTDREGGSLVPALAWWPGQIKAGSDNHDIVGGLDLMATFASLAGVTLPTKDREGVPMVFDSYDMSNVLFDEGKPLRRKWFYFTESELSPGAVRVDRWKAVFNTRGDNGALAGSNTPGQELGWRGDQTYVATVPAIYDLWADPQERYDLFMNSFTEKTWTLPIFNKATQDLMKSYVEYPPRPLQSEVFTGPLEIKQFRNIEKAKLLLKEKGIVIPELEGK